VGEQPAVRPETLSSLGVSFLKKTTTFSGYGFDSSSLTSPHSLALPLEGRYDTGAPPTKILSRQIFNFKHPAQQRRQAGYH